MTRVVPLVIAQFEFVPAAGQAGYPPSSVLCHVAKLDPFQSRVVIVKYRPISIGAHRMSVLSAFNLDSSSLEGKRKEVTFNVEKCLQLDYRHVVTGDDVVKVQGTL